jgi:hypothetical protein
MGKPPADLPAIGDRVIWRGRGAAGELERVDERGWASVKWDTGTTAPRLVHHHELSKL